MLCEQPYGEPIRTPRAPTNPWRNTAVKISPRRRGEGKLDR